MVNIDDTDDTRVGANDISVNCVNKCLCMCMLFMIMKMCHAADVTVGGSVEDQFGNTMRVRC